MYILGCILAPLATHDGPDPHQQQPQRLRRSTTAEIHNKGSLVSWRSNNSKKIPSGNNYSSSKSSILINKNQQTTIV